MKTTTCRFLTSVFGKMEKTISRTVAEVECEDYDWAGLHCSRPRINLRPKLSDV